MQKKEKMSLSFGIIKNVEFIVGFCITLSCQFSYFVTLLKMSTNSFLKIVIKSNFETEFVNYCKVDVDKVRNCGK